MTLWIHGDIVQLCASMQKALAGRTLESTNDAQWRTQRWFLSGMSADTPEFDPRCGPVDVRSLFASRAQALRWKAASERGLDDELRRLGKENWLRWLKEHPMRLDAANTVFRWLSETAVVRLCRKLRRAGLRTLPLWGPLQPWGEDSSGSRSIWVGVPLVRPGGLVIHFPLQSRNQAQVWVSSAEELAAVAPTGVCAFLARDVAAGTVSERIVVALNRCAEECQQLTGETEDRDAPFEDTTAIELEGSNPRDNVSSPTLLNLGNRDIPHGEAHLGVFVSHLRLLLDNSDEILGKPWLSRSVPEVAKIWLRWAGRSNLSIGSLLKAWSMGYLTKPCDCGEEICYFSVHYLSMQSSRAVGVCSGCGADLGAPVSVTGREALDVLGNVLGDGVLVSGDVDGDSSVPFEFLPAMLAGEPGGSVLRARRGGPVAVFDYARWELVELTPGQVWSDVLARRECRGTGVVTDVGGDCLDRALGGARARWSHECLDTGPGGTEVRGIPWGVQWVLRVRDEQGIARVLMTVKDGSLYVRGRGRVAMVDRPMPRQVLAEWAARQGLVCWPLA